MGTYSNEGIYLPTRGEVGWDDELNAFFTRLGEEYTNVKNPGIGAVGDGLTDDSEAIRTAMDAVAGGGNLYFPAGTYRVTLAGRVFPVGFGLGNFFELTGVIAQIPSDVRIFGEPGATIVMEGVPAEDYLGPDYLDQYTVFAMGGGESNILISGLTFQGENNPFVKYSENQAAPIRAYCGSLVEDITVRDCHFRDLYGFGIQGEGSSQFLDRMNVIACSFVDVGNSLNVNSDNSVQIDNTFSNSDGLESSGLNVTIAGNRFQDVTGSAIAIGGRTTADTVGEVRGVVVANNAITGGLTNGIVIADGIRGAVISANTITRCDVAAISMTYSTGYPPSDCLITGNTIFGNCKVGSGTSAVLIGGGGDHSVIGNNIFDEDSSVDYWQQDGVSVFETGHTIMGNRIYTTDRLGTSRCISLQNGSDAYVYDNYLSGTANLVVYSGTAAPAQGSFMSSGPTDVWLESLHSGGHAWKMRANGKLEWAELYGSYDTSIERSAANVVSLGSNDALKTGAAAHGSLPAATDYAAGSQFYCTTDKQPLWSDATNWVEADGTNH